AEAVALDLAPFVAVEAEVEDGRQRRIAVGEREEAVADVTRRDHSIGAPEAPGAAAVVTGGHDRREPLSIADGLARVTGPKERSPETLEQDGQARPAAQGHDSEGASGRSRPHRFLAIDRAHRGHRGLIRPATVGRAHLFPSEPREPDVRRSDRSD